MCLPFIPDGTPSDARARADAHFEQLLRDVTRERAQENRPADGISAVGAGDDCDLCDVDDWTPVDLKSFAAWAGGWLLRWVGYAVLVGAAVYAACWAMARGQ